jgi:type II secretory pathway pseudopilin PulG
MNSSNRHRIDAFTIFEVTVVMAIMSVIITIISITFVRFHEQLKISQDISEELNNFRMVRSTLWKDFTTADSIAFDNEELKIYRDQMTIKYQAIDEKLHRNHTGEWQNLQLDVESIYQDSLSGMKNYHINFLWKGEEMDWNFMDKPSLAVRINNHFNNLR